MYLFSFYLNGRETKKAGSNPQMLQQVEPGHTEARTRELCPGLPHRKGKDPILEAASTVCHGAHEQKPGSEAKVGLETLEF